MNDNTTSLGTQLKDVLEAFLQVDLIGVSDTRKIVTEQGVSVLFVPEADLELLLLLYKSDNRPFTVLSEKEDEPDLSYKVVGILTKYEAVVVRWDEYILAAQQAEVTSEASEAESDDSEEEEFINAL